MSSLTSRSSTPHTLVLFDPSETGNEGQLGSAFAIFRFFSF